MLPLSLSLRPLHPPLLPNLSQQSPGLPPFNNNNLQAFQLIVLASYLLGVPNPSPCHPLA